MGHLYVKIAAFAALLVSGTALAQGTTTDGTPVSELSCESTGGALFGLCTAYCEAVDCDTTYSPACDPLDEAITTLLAEEDYSWTGECAPPDDGGDGTCRESCDADLEAALARCNKEIITKGPTCWDRAFDRYEGCLVHQCGELGDCEELFCGPPGGGGPGNCQCSDLCPQACG